MESEIITCVEVVYPSGEIVWEPLREYRTNPPVGTYLLHNHRKIKCD